jgi:hypothetical protein
MDFWVILRGILTNGAGFSGIVGIGWAGVCLKLMWSKFVGGDRSGAMPVLCAVVAPPMLRIRRVEHENVRLCSSGHIIRLFR